MKLLRLCCAAMASVAMAAHAGGEAVRSVDTGETFAHIGRILNARMEPAAPGVWIDLLVDCGDYVSAGQKLAIQRDSRGDVVQVFNASVSGKVKMIARHGPGDGRGTILEIRIDRHGEDVATTAPTVPPDE